MTYDEAVEYIHSVSWKGSVPGLSRITELCKRLGDPQKKLRFIHIAGTNGKGSVSAMLYSVLNAAGVRAGLFTSPYLVKFNERMSALGQDISDSELASSGRFHHISPRSCVHQLLPLTFLLHQPI